jgi:hypothetical protein
MKAHGFGKWHVRIYSLSYPSPTGKGNELTGVDRELLVVRSIHEDPPISNEVSRW